jgi:hypothetical protein
MELVLAAVLTALAIARLTTLIVHDTILDRVRHELFLLSPPPDDFDRGYLYQQWDRVPWHRRRSIGRVATHRRRQGLPPRRPGFLGSLLSCDRCVGVWVTLGVLGAWTTYPEPTLVLVAVFGLAQAAIIATRAGGR